MRLLFTITAFLCCHTIIFAQTFNSLLDLDSLHEYGLNVEVLPSSGNYFITINKSTVGDWDTGAIEIDAATGDTLWYSFFGQPLTDEATAFIAPLNDSTFITCGSYWDTTGLRSGYIVAYSSNGDTLWTRRYPDSLDNAFFDIAIRDTTIVVAGQYVEGTSYNAWAAEIDKNNGDTIWTNIYGGGVQDVFYSVDTTADGGYIMSGYSYSFGAEPTGYVELDKHTHQHVRWPNIFSLGDAGSTPNSKTGAAIRKQAPVVVENLLAVLAGQVNCIG
jgi:hypothetical protein